MFQISVLVIVFAGSAAQLGFNYCESIVRHLDCSTFSDDPQCGSDGVTYRSKCQYSLAYCNNKGITIVHAGTCGTAVVSNSTGNIVFELFCQELFHMDCPPDRHMVCASNGVTFLNICEFEKELCFHRHLHIVDFKTCKVV